MSSYTDKPPEQLQPLDLAHDIRQLVEVYDKHFNAASRACRATAWWRVHIWFRHGLEAARCRRRLRLLCHGCYTLPPDMVRRTFENDRWRVCEVDSELYVNGLKVWPVPPFHLIGLIGTLYLRRRLNLVPEYDEHG